MAAASINCTISIVPRRRPVSSPDLTWSRPHGNQKAPSYKVPVAPTYCSGERPSCLVYGFKGLVVDFLSSHPGHHVNPRRVNGSGVETLFGQLKHATSGSHSYETAKATLLTKRQIQGGKRKDDYRDTPLNNRQSELRRKP